MSKIEYLPIAAEALYVLVQWPWSQSLMEEPWYSECILVNDENHLETVGSSAVMVPIMKYRTWLREQKFAN